VRRFNQHADASLGD